MAEASVTLTMAVHLERQASLLLSRDGDAKTAKFLPREKIAFRALAGQWVHSTDGFKLQLVAVTLPRWLAKKEGLA